MIRNCKNCASRIRFDIKSQKLICDTCNSHFDVGEYKTQYDNEDMDCDIYCCSSCGAELIINNTESSTFCPFCGNATVVLSRVARIKRPEVIIPFEIEPEEAVKNINLMFKKGFFIPNVVHPEPSDMRGIYIPYYVTNIEFDGSSLFKEKSSRYSSKNPPIRLSGYCSCNWVTTDASKKLNDTFSQRLEPYYFDKFKPFDEDYLLGFYSDIADVDESTAITTARTRVMHAADQKFRNYIPTIRIHPESYDVKTRFTTEVYDKPVTGMLPVWFYTYKYEGKPYTIAVNGQTGKVTGGVPWSKTKFILLTALLTILFTAIMFLPAILFDKTLLALFFIIMFPCILIALLVISKMISDIGGYKTFIDSLRMTNIASSNSLTNFVNKREGGK